MPRTLKRDDGSKFDPIPTEAESYRDGFESGLRWDMAESPWTPGGPHVCRAAAFDRPKWKAYCEAQARNYVKWHEGWRDGYARQQEQGEQRDAKEARNAVLDEAIAALRGYAGLTPDERLIASTVVGCLKRSCLSG
jgi:hypothetical protein